MSNYLFFFKVGILVLGSIFSSAGIERRGPCVIRIMVYSWHILGLAFGHHQLILIRPKRTVFTLGKGGKVCDQNNPRHDSL
jgi:hypothetical protein